MIVPPLRCVWMLIFPMACALTSLDAKGQTTSKGISRQELVYYLSKSINIHGFSDYCKTPTGRYPGPDSLNDRVVDNHELNNTSVDPRLFHFQQDTRSGKTFARYTDLLRLIGNVKPKLVTDAITQWGGGVSWEPWQMDWQTHLNRARHTVEDIKNIDTEIIVQAAVNELVDDALINAIGDVPQWVFREFGLLPENRKFSKAAMRFEDFSSNPEHSWSGSGIVPDISKLETQMYFYYLGVSYINTGCESIQFSQVKLMNNQSDDGTHWGKVFDRLRAYGDRIPKIRFVLITGHTTGMKQKDGTLIFDFHSSPLRPSENGYGRNENGGGCFIDDAQCWEGRGKIYKQSLGGLTPSGWQCAELPGLVFLDNWGPDVTQGGEPAGAGCNQYHWDEISWFALQDEAYRNEWLKYANDRIKYLDSNIYFSLPVKRVIVTSTKDTFISVDYFANNPTQDKAILPVVNTIQDLAHGLVARYRVQPCAAYGQEDVIKELIAHGTRGEKYLPVVSIFPNPVSDWLYLKVTARRYVSLRMHCTIIDAIGAKTIGSHLMDAPLSQIDFSQFSSGVYLIRILDEDGNTLLSSSIVKR